MRKLRHPYIVTLKEVVTTTAQTYIVMELCVLPLNGKDVESLPAALRIRRESDALLW